MEYIFHYFWEQQNVKELDVITGSLSDVYVNIILHRSIKLLIINPVLWVKEGNTVKV